MKHTVYFKEMHKYILFACMATLFVPMAMAQSPIVLGKDIMVFHKNDKVVFYGKTEGGKVGIYLVAIGNGALGPQKLLYTVEAANGFTPEKVELVEVKSSMPKSDVIDSVRIIRVSYKAEGEKAFARQKCKYLVLKMHKYMGYGFDNSAQGEFPKVYEIKLGSANYGSAEFYACNNGLMVNYSAYPEGNTQAQAMYDSRDFYKTPNYYKYCSYALYYYDPTTRKATNMYPKDPVASYPMYAQIDVNGLKEGSEWMKKNCNYNSDCFFFYSKVRENTSNYYMQPRLLFWDACGTLTEIDVALDNNDNPLGKYIDVEQEDMSAMSSTYSPNGIYSPESNAFLLYDKKEPESKGGTWGQYFSEYLATNGNRQLSIFGAKETLSNGNTWARYYYVSFGSKTYSLRAAQSGILGRPIMVKAKYDITSFKRAETSDNNATYIIRNDGNYKTAFVKNLRDYCDKHETGYGDYFDVLTSNLSRPIQFSKYGLCFVLENGDNTLFAALAGGKFYRIPALDSVVPAKFKLGSVVDVQSQSLAHPLLLTSDYTDNTYDYRFLGTVHFNSTTGYSLNRWKEGNLSYKLVGVIGGKAAVLTDRKFHDFASRPNPITNFIVKNLDGNPEKVSAKVTITGEYSRADVVNLKSEHSDNLGYIHIYNYGDGEYKGKGKMFYYSESTEKIPKVKELTFEPDFNKIDIDEDNSDMSHLIYEVDGVVKVIDIFTYSER